MLHSDDREKNPSAGSELYQQDSAAVVAPTRLSAGAPAAAHQPEEQQGSSICPCTPTTAFTQFSHCVREKYIYTVTDGSLEKQDRYTAMYSKS